MNMRRFREENDRKFLKLVIFTTTNLYLPKR